MQFTPKTNDEIAADKSKFGAWPEGDYEFQIVGASDAVSKKGNEMIVLDLIAYDTHGNEKKLKDWILEAAAVKLKAACEAVGLHDAYANGSVTARDFIRGQGHLILMIDKQDGFPDRNKVRGYVGGPLGATKRAAPANRAARTGHATHGAQGGNMGSDLSDEIPF